MTTFNLGAIILVNNDLTDNVEAAIQRQLEINETIDGYEFDQRVLADPNYPTVVRSNNWRLLVIRSFYDLTNRNLMDVVIFVKAGLAYVESNKFGPPGQSFQVDRMQLDKILVAQTQPPCPPGNTNNIQSNILYPLFERPNPDLYPFGSNNLRPRGDGDFDDDDDDD